MYKETIYSQRKLIKIISLKYQQCLTTCAIKIVRIKQKRRNKTYNDNHNDIYYNKNISNKDQLDLSLSNVKSDD